MTTTEHPLAEQNYIPGDLMAVSFVFFMFSPTPADYILLD